MLKVNARRVGVAFLGIVVLGVAHVLLVLAVQILALPRLEIPLAFDGYIVPSDRESVHWVLLALFAVGLATLDIGAVRGRKAVAATVGIGTLAAAAVASLYLVRFGSAVLSVRRALELWTSAPPLIHPGFQLHDVRAILMSGQAGLSALTLAVALGVLFLRLTPSSHRAAIVLLQAVLLFAVGSMFTLRQAQIDESGCFSLWPALATSAHPVWEGLALQSVGFWIACISLISEGLVGSRRLVCWAVPLVLGVLYARGGGRWGAAVECQQIDLPENSVSVAALGWVPGFALQTRTSTEFIVDVDKTGVHFGQKRLDTPTLGELLSTRTRSLYDVSAGGLPPLVVRASDEAPLEMLRRVAVEASRAGFSDVLLEFAIQRDVSVGWGVHVHGSQFWRMHFPRGSGCISKLATVAQATAHDLLECSGRSDPK